MIANQENSVVKDLNYSLLQSLSDKYGNAFYLLESPTFEKNYEELEAVFQKYYPKFNIAYSYKTNYIPELVKIVDRHGGYAEVVSDMEAEVAIRSGVAAERIIWNGPIKNYVKVEELILKGSLINIDSIDELDYITNLSQEYPEKAFRVGLRCNFDVGDDVVSRFGFDTTGADFKKALEIICNSKNIKLISLQAHFAKRKPEYWTKRTEGMLSVYKMVHDIYGLSPEIIDLGGAIYGHMPDSLRNQLGIESVTFDDYASRSAKLVADYFKDKTDAPHLFVEPGSAIAGNSMRFVGRVETIKSVRGKYIATVLGSQKNISMSGINPPMEVISKSDSDEVYKDIDLAGYTCIESDFLYKGYSGKLAVGDYVVFSNCGSYSIVMKPPFIFPNFPVIDIYSDKLIKRAEVFDDIFKTYVF